MQAVVDVVFQVLNAFVCVVAVCCACYALPYFIARGIREGWNGR